MILIFLGIFLPADTAIYMIAFAHKGLRRRIANPGGNACNKHVFHECNFFQM